MLKVIYYYNQKDDKSTKELIINGDTISWLLDTMTKYADNKKLSCLASLVLLNIVDKDMLDLDYLEHDIIKKFNAVLRKIEIFDNPS